ncbi:MAG: bacillithiol biosynthesis BshC [Flavobacteriales bacterium]|nr:bacillithiol biosynthesis BshC [Flavobacteriales bacterium]
MQRLALPYLATGQFKPIVLDYLQDEPKVHPFRVWPFNRAASEKALTARHFDPGKRTIVIAAIRRQYDGLSIPPQVEEHLQRLAEPDTYTVTTGHQLCLFGGPLFVLFKILNTVRLARELSTPQRTVVPVFWMASEDHDLAEVDHVFLRCTLVHWPAGATGAVGRIPLSMIDEVVSRAIALLGDGSGAAEIAGILRSAYQDGKTLAQATRIFIDGLFGRFGVVVVDGDDPTLKRLFAPLMQEELLNEVVARSVHYAEQQMPVEYAPQAHARGQSLSSQPWATRPFGAGGRWLQSDGRRPCVQHAGIIGPLGALSGSVLAERAAPSVVPGECATQYCLRGRWGGGGVLVAVTVALPGVPSADARGMPPHVRPISTGGHGGTDQSAWP